MGRYRRPPSARGDQLRRVSGHGGARAPASGCRPRSTDALGRRQANNVLVYGEWWRIVTAMFVHVGIIHLAANMWCLWNLGLLAEPLMGSFGLFAAYILTGAGGNLLSTLYNWVADSRRSGAPYFPGRRGRFRRRLWHRRRTHRAAEVETVARAATGSAKTAQVGHLFRGDQPRDWPFGQLRQRIYRRGGRQFGAHRRFSVRAAFCGSDGAAHRLLAERVPVQNAVDRCACGVTCWCLFGFYVAHVPTAARMRPAT